MVSVPIGVYAGVELVCDIGVMRSSIGRGMSTEAASSVCVLAETAASVSIRIDAGIKLVGNVRIVRTGIGGCVVMVRSNSKGSASSSTAGVVNSSGRNTISVGVYSRIHFVGDIRVVRAIVGL